MPFVQSFFSPGEFRSGAKASAEGSCATGYLSRRFCEEDKCPVAEFPFLRSRKMLAYNNERRSTLTVDAPSFSSYEAPLTLTLGQIASLEIELHIRAATEQGGKPTDGLSKTRASMATAAPSGYNLANGVTIVVETSKSESFPN